MTLVALSPAPTAVPSVAGPANNSAAASGFGAVMTDANAALVAADSSAAPVGTVAAAELFAWPATEAELFAWPAGE